MWVLNPFLWKRQEGLFFHRQILETLIWSWRHYDFITVNTHTLNPTNKFKTWFFHFYSIFIILSLSRSPHFSAFCLLLPSCFSSLSSLLFLTQAPSLLSSLTSGRFCLLPQALWLIFQSFISTNVRQSFCRLSREKKRWKERWGNGNKYHG